MPPVPTLSDPTFVRKEPRNAVERFALRLIRDERDLPFVWLSLEMTLVLLPAGLALFVPGVFRAWLAPLTGRSSSACSSIDTC